MQYVTEGPYINKCLVIENCWFYRVNTHIDIRNTRLSKLLNTPPQHTHIYSMSGHLHHWWPAVIIPPREFSIDFTDYPNIKLRRWINQSNHQLEPVAEKKSSRHPLSLIKIHKHGSDWNQTVSWGEGELSLCVATQHPILVWTHLHMSKKYITRLDHWHYTRQVSDVHMSFFFWIKLEFVSAVGAVQCVSCERSISSSVHQNICT